MNDSIQDKKGVSRRNFLGLAAIGAVILSSLATLAGMLRFTKPNVHFEESKKVKIGKPESFPVGTVKKFEDQNFFVFADTDGLHAISSVCTHLGCLVAMTESGFQCPVMAQNITRKVRLSLDRHPEVCPGWISAGGLMAPWLWMRERK